MRRKTIVVRFLVPLCLALLNVQVFAQRDRLSIEQFLDWEYVASPQISPDGKQIVYTKHWPDKVNDSYEDEIRIMDVDGGHNRFLVRLTNTTGSMPTLPCGIHRIACLRYCICAAGLKNIKGNSVRSPTVREGKIRGRQMLSGRDRCPP